MHSIGKSFINYLPGFPVVSLFPLGFCVTDWPPLEIEVVKFSSSWFLLDSTIRENSNIVDESLMTRLIKKRPIRALLPF